jgi:hypothetical protein
MPLPVVGVHLNKINPRMPQANVITPRSAFDFFRLVSRSSSRFALGTMSDKEILVLHKNL